MLLVEHDQPKIRRRSKDGTACPDHDLDFALRDPPPMLVTLDVGHVAMKHRHSIEPRPEAGDRLRRQADLGHKQNRLPAKSHDFLNGLDIHLGLAAARHAVNENRAVLGGVQCIANCSQCRNLIGVQLERRLPRMARFVRLAPLPFAQRWRR